MVQAWVLRRKHRHRDRETGVHTLIPPPHLPQAVEWSGRHRDAFLLQEPTYSLVGEKRQLR